jgi:hypothetical protein
MPKKSGRQGDCGHLKVRTLKVKKGWSYTTTPRICLHVMDRYNLTLLYLLQDMTWIFMYFRPGRVYAHIITSRSRSLCCGPLVLDFVNNFNTSTNSASALLCLCMLHTTHSEICLYLIEILTIHRNRYLVNGEIYNRSYSIIVLGRQLLVRSYCVPDGKHSVM